MLRGLEVKVIDFGLAKAITDGGKEIDLTKGGFIGTPAFASPEQFSGAAADARSDIYSLGITLWYALTGEVPYQGKTIEEIRHCQNDLPLPVQNLIARKIPTPVIQLLRQILAVDPTQRPGSARDFMGSLDTCRSRLGLIPAKETKARQTVRMLAAIAAAAAIGAVGFFAFRPSQQQSVRAIAGSTQVAPTPTVISTKSIAVLPFENFSADKENAFFADGIQDDILTALTKIADLKVISRTSVISYHAGATRNLREIALALGVAHILEGSVRRAGGKMRVTAQLIDARNDSHVWAETYDRDVADVFAIQSEIAKGIAAALQAKLTHREEQALAVNPTNNPEAYDAYLRGIAYSERLRPILRDTAEDNLEAIRSFRQAVTLDPTFALAWARLARASGIGCVDNDGEDFRALCEQAKPAADKALALQPELAESQLAQGYWHYYVEGHFDLAIPWFEKAEQLSPQDSSVLRALGLVFRRKGVWQRCLEYFARAREIDPLNTKLLADNAEVLAALRQFPEALKAYDKILDMIPNDPSALAGKIGVYQAQGDLEAAAALLAPLDPAPDSPLFFAKTNQLIYERRYQEAVAGLQNALRSPAATEPDSAWLAVRIQCFLAWLEEISGDRNIARKRWENIRSQIEEFSKGRPLQMLDNSSPAGFANINLAGAYVGLGDANKGFAILREAVASMGGNPITTPLAENFICVSAARSGHKDMALEGLSNLAQRPYGRVTYGDLKFHPLWDPLRGDARFEKLLEETRKPIALK